MGPSAWGIVKGGAVGIVEDPRQDMRASCSMEKCLLGSVWYVRGRVDQVQASALRTWDLFLSWDN